MGLWPVLLVLLISGSSRIIDARPHPSSSGIKTHAHFAMTLLVKQALGYLADNKTQTEIVGVLHKSCARALSFKQEVKLCEKIPLLSLQLEEDKRDLCRRVITGVLEKMKDPDTQCERMVFEYGPLVLANAEQFLETRDVCVAVHACISSLEARHSSS